MLINSDDRPSIPTSCSNCGAANRRLLHHVRHRGIFRRLCTDCVLRLHPQSFCPTCFQVYPPPPQNDAVITCSKCYSASHSHCVSSSPPSSPNHYICPLCSNPNSPIFKLEKRKNDAEVCRAMDRDAAKKLLAAAKISAMSMNKAAVAAKLEAERRAKEASFARKRAREALEHLAYLVGKEKLRKKEANLGKVGNGVAQLKVEINVDVVNSGSSGIVDEEDVDVIGEVDGDAVELCENEKMPASMELDDEDDDDDDDDDDDQEDFLVMDEDERENS